MILSYYAVVAGWALQHIGAALSGDFQAQRAGQLATICRPAGRASSLVLWQSIFMIMTVAVVIGGVVKGLGVAVRVMMPFCCSCWCCC